VSVQAARRPLTNLDVLMGTVVIVLGVSLIVTVVNQALSTVLGLRGRNLRWGLAMLIQELHPERFEPPVHSQHAGA
jgi:hypothetical protein